MQRLYRDWIILEKGGSQGETETEALSNLQEALELHFEPPCATIISPLQKIEIEINAA